MADYSADIVKKQRDHENRAERLETIESLSLSDELAHALGAGIPASAGVALDASRHDHIHEITASDNPGAKVSFLQTDASGHLTLVQLNSTANHTTTTLTDHIGEHTGSHGVVVDNHLTMALTKGIAGTIYTLDDNVATSFTLATYSAVLLVTCAVSSHIGLVYVQPSAGTAECVSYLGASVGVSAGTLTNGAPPTGGGTDGEICISAHTDGKVYIKNTIGFALNIGILILGGI